MLVVSDESNPAIEQDVILEHPANMLYIDFGLILEPGATNEDVTEALHEDQFGLALPRVSTLVKTTPV